MRKTIIVLLACSLFAGVNRLEAQSLQHTAWKFYVESLHDTLTMHIGVDTTFSTSSSGEMIVRSLFRTAGDTVRLRDIDGQYPCMDGEGVYRYVIDGDRMNFIQVTDPCEGRGNALRDCKFIKVK